MGLELTFHIDLKSDYHISAGHGIGAGIDSALLREVDGVPVIRGTTLAGLLRDGLYRLMQLSPLAGQRGCQAAGLPNGKRFCGEAEPVESRRLCPVCRLLGTPSAPKEWHISSARPVSARNLEAAGAKNWRQGRTAAHLVHRARISRRTRRALPRHLFSQEEGHSQITFTFTIKTSNSGPSALDEASLWVAAARNIRQLGRSRRRGQGECLFNVVACKGGGGTLPTESDKLQQHLLECFAATWLRGKVEPPGTDVRKSFTVRAAQTARAAQNNAPLRMRLIARLDEPLLIASRTEVGNQFESLPMITGQTLRGALAFKAFRRFLLSDKEGKPYEWFTRVFLRGGVTFPTLYPVMLIHGGDLYSPAVPAPLNLLSCKTAPGLPVYGHGLYCGPSDSDEPHSCRWPGCGSAMKPLDGFLVLNKALWKDTLFRLEPGLRSELHVSINPVTGRAVEGELFTYVALEAGQYFVGEIRCTDEASWAAFQELTGMAAKTPKRIRLGKGGRRGYGQVTLWIDELQPSDPLVWIQQPMDSNRAPDPGNIGLSLLTDAIVADTWGRFANTFERGWLSRALGLSVEIIPDSVCVQTRVVDGFNVHLGLPRWRDVALTAGSAVRLRLVDPPNDWREKLADIENEGIGLRRNEGFGQVAFNHPVYEQCESIVQNTYILPPQVRRGNDPLDPSIDEIEEEWRNRLEEEGDGWKACHNECFTAVARWLHGRRRRLPAELSAQLPDLGQPAKSVYSLIEDYGDRDRLDKKNRLQTQKEGLELIGRLLVELSGKEKAFWARGIRMLAEKVAGAAER